MGIFLYISFPWDAVFGGRSCGGKIVKGGANKLTPLNIKIII